MSRRQQRKDDLEGRLNREEEGKKSTSSGIEIVRSWGEEKAREEQEKGGKERERKRERL